MNLATAIAIFAEDHNQSQSGSSIINLPDSITTPKLRDLARRRLTKTNPDIDSAAKKLKVKKLIDDAFNQKVSPDSQADNAAFVGKPYRVQDTHYGHLISEHDNESSAETAATGRPFSRVIHAPEWQHDQNVRDTIRKKVSGGK